MNLTYIMKHMMSYMGMTLMLKYNQENMSMKSIPPRTPLLYSKSGVYLFFLFLIQNIVCGYSQSTFCAKNIKNIIFSPNEI